MNRCEQVAVNASRASGSQAFRTCGVAMMTLHFCANSCASSAVAKPCCTRPTFGRSTLGATMPSSWSTPSVSNLPAICSRSASDGHQDQKALQASGDQEGQHRLGLAGSCRHDDRGRRGAFGRPVAEDCVQGAQLRRSYARILSGARVVGDGVSVGVEDDRRIVSKQESRLAP